MHEGWANVSQPHAGQCIKDDHGVSTGQCIGDDCGVSAGQCMSDGQVYPSHMLASA